MRFLPPSQTASSAINKRLIEEGSGITGPQGPPSQGGLKVMLSNTSAPAVPVKTADSNGRGRPPSGDAALKISCAPSRILATKLPPPSRPEYRFTTPSSGPKLV